jgi:sulfatase maturation enzyme AslB (radical SAM superfamily)
MKVLDIYITEICNLNCEYCYVELKKNEVDGIKVPEFTQRVNLLEYDSIKFFWWEPLLKWKEIVQIIEIVFEKNKRIRFSLITNGLLLSKEKLQFVREHNASVTISLHENSFKKTLSREFLSMLYPFKNVVGFIILFSYKNPEIASKVFFLLASAGFTNFSLSPLANIFWNEKTFEILRQTLLKIQLYAQKNRALKFSDSEALYLKNLANDDYCKKNQVDKSGTKKNCTRFHREKELDNSEFVSHIHYVFEKYNDCSHCHNRWFCVCPIWRYLDNEKDALNEEHLAKNFHTLNEIMIHFHRNIAQIQWKKNFMTHQIDEIRFNLTEQCNLRCEYCYLDFTNKKLDVSVGKNIIDFYLEQPWDTKTLSFFWGEPLLEFPLLKQLVLYASEKSKGLWKTIFFKIATNGILLKEESISFLKKYNFEVHLSINGTKQINDATRDRSSDIFVSKMKLLKNCNFPWENLIALFVIFPHTLSSLEESIKYIISLWFSRILFEIYLGNKWPWNEDSYRNLEDSLLKLWKREILNTISLENLSKKSWRTVLDISTEGKIQENSLEFFQTSVDFTPKKVLDSIFAKF